MPYYVYVAECADGTYYCGIALDPSKRIKEHNTSKTGAKYTRSRRPVSLIYLEEHANRTQAQRREYFIKKLNHQQKKQLIINAATIS